MIVRKGTAAQPACYTAPHEAWLDNLDHLYMVTVLVVAGDKALLIRYDEPGPYGRKTGAQVLAPTQWVYPVEAVQIEGRQTAALPFGQGTTILPYSWVSLRTLPDAGPVDDPLGQLADDGGKGHD